MNRKFKHGMTLLEVLAVALILLILLVVLFPGTAGDGESAEKGNCISNLNQISKMLIMYQSDYDDRLPLQVYTVDGDHRVDPLGNATGTKGYSIYDALYAYSRTETVFHDPAVEAPKKLPLLSLLQAASGGRIQKTMGLVHSTDYLYNMSLFGNQAFVSSSNRHASLKESDIPFPENTSAFYDGKFLPKGRHR